MLQRNTLQWLTGALLVSCVLSGCDTNKTLSAMFGETRTVPDGAKVDFGAPHPPILNPGATGATPGDTGVRHVPEENTQSQPSSGSFIAGQVAVQPPASALAQASLSAGGDTGGDTSAGAPPPDNGSYPTLADVPPTPPRPSRDDTAAQFNALTAQRAASENARQQLMGDPSATVLTSPQTGRMVGDARVQPPSPPVAAYIPATAPPAAPAGAMLPYAPVPVQVVQAAPDAPAPVAAGNGGGFDHWLHTLFSSDDNAAPAAAARKPLVENTAPSAIASVPAPGPMAVAIPPVINPSPAAGLQEQNAFVAPAENGFVLQAAPQAAQTIAQSPLPPAAASGMEEPVHLHPPASVGQSAPPAPMPAQADSDATDNAANASVHLVPPSSSGGTVNLSSSSHYLADSRYAERRSQPLPADADSD